MRNKIRKYIKRIKSFNLFNYFINKKVLTLTQQKELQEGVIIAYKAKIAQKTAEKRVLEGKILYARNLIVDYKDQLDKINIIVELYN